MSNSVSKSDLSQASQRLVELGQETNHGEIGPFEVLNGEPVLDPPPTVLRTFLISNDNGPNPLRSTKDFILRKEWLEVFAIFDRERSFMVKRLVIKGGLPVRIDIERARPV